MRYRDLKDERDAAIERAKEAERLSMKSEFDKQAAAFEEEKAALLARISEDSETSYRRGFNEGLNAMLAAACGSCRDLTKVEQTMAPYPTISDVVKGRVVHVDE